MAKRYVKIGFSSIKDDELSTLAGTIISAMNENEYFPEPNPLIEDVQTVLDDYRNKLEISTRKGSPLDTSEKNHARAELEDLLKKLGFYVNHTANGVVRMVLSSGFPLKNERQPLLVPQSPERIRLKDGRQRKQIDLSFDSVKGAWEYEYCYSHALDEQGDAVWSEIFNTTNSMSNVVAPVIPGETYRFRVRARNGRGSSEWNESQGFMAR